ncbi:MAG TPA: sigma-E factor negative regulatory protein, partial [Burkholderiaceae bacterium]|nr:sigma-E factor negative regulatory protein [Burkholderiaceae bacterium]
MVMRNEDLSALMDGETTADESARVSARWQDDSHTRSTWHAYHLIGDVLRSEDLSSPPAQDAALLARVRERLATEPVVMAPSP